MNSTVISRWLLWRENSRSAGRLFYERLADDLVTNMGLIKWISLIGCLVIEMIPAPVKTRPSRMVELSDIKFAAGKALIAGCYNAYYPASTKLKRVYRHIELGEFSLVKWLEFSSNITDEGFTIKESIISKEKPDVSDWADENVMRESDYRCAPEGLARIEYAKRGRESRSNIFKTLKTAGISYPNENEWKAGKKWQAWFLVETHHRKTTPAKIVTRATHTFQYEIVGRESITVPAGTFEAFKVTVVESVRVHVNNTGFKMPMNQSVKYLCWHAKDIGLVKSLGQSKTGLELISVEK
jgi:hypothetical protein